MVLAGLGSLLAEPISIQGANGKVVPFAGIKLAKPEGLVLQVRPDSPQTLVSWDKIDLAALERDHPEIHAAYRRSRLGYPTVLELGTFEPKPMSAELDALLDSVSLHAGARYSPAEDVGVRAYLYQHATGAPLPLRFGAPRRELRQGDQFPLVVWLHGSGSGGEDNARNVNMKLVETLFPRTGDPKPAFGECFLLAPQCREGTTWWNAPPRSGYPGGQTLDFIDVLCEAIPAIDPTRIYILGYSQGAFAVPHLVTAYPNRFAAAVMIAGGSKGPYAPWDKRNVVPTWTFFSTDDPVVMQYNGVVAQMVSQLRQLAPIDTKVTVYEDAGHGGTLTRAFGEELLFSWLFTFRIKDPPVRDLEQFRAKFK